MGQIIEGLYRVIEEYVSGLKVPAGNLIDKITAGPSGPLPSGGDTGSGYTPNPDAVTRTQVRKNSAGTTFERRRLNLIEGTGVTLTVADDSGDEEVDITIAASGGGGGSIDITDGTTTVTAATSLTFPSGTVTSAGAGLAEYTPAGGGSGVAANSFYAHKNSVDQSITNSTFTKVTFGTEDWDTGGYWDTSTSVFQPTVACKFEFTVVYQWDANGAYRHYTTLYKNGSRYRETISHSGFAAAFTAQATFLVDLNGSTDYVEFYAYQNSGGTRTLYGDPLGTWVFGKRVE